MITELIEKVLMVFTWVIPDKRSCRKNIAHGATMVPGLNY